jgi:DNA-binding transcriptional ArsR family regulator
MLFINDNEEGIGCAAIEQRSLRAAASPLAGRILRELAQQPMHAAQLSSHLREPEQKVHYHVRRLRDAHLVAIDHTEEGRGGTVKVLRLSAPAYALVLGVPAPMAAAHESDIPAALEPFFPDGILDATIVLGSPDPHGPEAARSRDAAYAAELGLVLGSLSRLRPSNLSTVFDTELRDWRRNLIVLGGPVVNKTAERINAARTGPVQYDVIRKIFLARGAEYSDENIGVIAVLESPLARGKRVLWIAGKRASGTRAAVLALVKRLDLVGEYLTQYGVAVVEGIDADSDGVVDDARILP